MNASSRLLSLLACTAILSVAVTVAAPLSFVPVQVRQPDGTVLDIFASGDEFYNWLHDAREYTIVRDPATARFVYAAAGKDRLFATPFVVGVDDPARAGLTPWVSLPPALLEAQRTSILAAHPSDPGFAPALGSFTNLAVFIRFSDEAEFTQKYSTYELMFNNSLAGTNSLFNYFQETSYGAVSILTRLYPIPSVSDTVISFRDSHPRGYYQPWDTVANPIGYKGGDNGSERTTREHTLLKAAIDSIAPFIPPSLNLDSDNDGRVDNVVFIVKGSPTGWASLLWPHAWSLYSYTASINGKRVYRYNLQLQSSINVGVLCHEMYHSLGAPDLYRYTTSGTPVGSWDIMATSASTPMHMGAHMKFRYGGWIPSEPVINAPGTYWLKPLTSPTKNIYKILSPYSTTEYFVVEYRKKVGTFERSLPGEGLLVYRILTTRSGNANGPPDEVYIYRPGGGFSGTYLSSAPFYVESGRDTINDQSDPSTLLSTGLPGGLTINAVGTRGYSISFQLGTPIPGVVDSLTATLVRPDSIRISWSARAQYRNRWFALERSDSASIGYAADPGTAINGGGTTPTSIRYTIIDRTNPGKPYYKIRSTDSTGAYVSSVATAKVTFPVGVEDAAPAPAAFALQQNYPNPFNPSTTIDFSIPNRERTTLRVYDLLGRVVATLVDGELPAGRHSVRLDGTGMASGVYLCRLTAGSDVQNRRMLLLK